MKRAILLSIILIPFFVAAQVAGRVVTRDNKGVPFATVAVKNSGLGTTADSLGYFSISGIQKFPATLVITFAGFEREEKIVQANNTNDIVIRLESLFQTDTVVITSRRRRELLQDVPIPISVVSGAQIEHAGAFNVNRVKELVPSVQLYTSNPRNTG